MMDKHKIQFIIMGKKVITRLLIGSFSFMTIFLLNAIAKKMIQED